MRGEREVAPDNLKKHVLKPEMQCAIGQLSRGPLRIKTGDSNYFFKLTPIVCKLQEAGSGANQITNKISEGRRKVLLKFAAGYLDGFSGMSLYVLEAGRPKLFYTTGAPTSFLPACGFDSGFYATGKTIFTFDQEILYPHIYALEEPLMRDLVYFPIMNADRQIGMLVAEGKEGAAGEVAPSLRFKCCGNCGELSRSHQDAILMDYFSQISAIYGNMMFNWFDSKTGLFNSTVLETELFPSMRRWAKKGKQFSVIFLDLDNFKKVNDTQGHAAGDRFLKLIAEALVRSTKSTTPAAVCSMDYPDFAVRWGGDEFMIILQNVAAEAVAKSMNNDGKTVLKRIIDSIGEVEQSGIRGTASFGIVDSAQIDVLRSTGPFELKEMADKMMYLAKNAGRSQGTQNWYAYMDALGNPVLGNYK